MPGTLSALCSKVAEATSQPQESLLLRIVTHSRPPLGRMPASGTHKVGWWGLSPARVVEECSLVKKRSVCMV